MASQDGICSSDLMVPLGRVQPTISRHTKVLVESGLIVGEKYGRFTMWRIVPERLAAVRQLLEEG